jgi:DNA-binding transcriptional LysR family regulator
MDRLEALEYFVDVADLGGFSAAARKLGTSRSHVSKQVAALEERLGVRLLQRTTRRVSLTDEGRAFRERIGAVLEELHEAEEAISDRQGSARGRLRISAPVTFGTRYLGAALADFMAANPNLEVELDLSDRFVDLVDGGFDLAIRIGVLRESSLIAARICATGGGVCASPAWLAEHGTPNDPAELSGHHCLRYSYASTSSVTFTRGVQERTVKLAGRLLANNGEVLIDAAVAGLGVTLAPDFLLAEPLRDGRLVSILEDWTLRVGGAVWAVYPHRRHLSARVRLFVDFLRARFGPIPPWEIADRAG